MKLNIILLAKLSILSLILLNTYPEFSISENTEFTVITNIDSCQTPWQIFNGYQGSSGNISKILKSQNGNYIVTGDFNRINNKLINDIAVWNNKEFHHIPLEDGDFFIKHINDVIELNQDTLIIAGSILDGAFSADISILLTSGKTINLRFPESGPPSTSAIKIGMKNDTLYALRSDNTLHYYHSDEWKTLPNTIYDFEIRNNSVYTLGAYQDQSGFYYGLAKLNTSNEPIFLGNNLNSTNYRKLDINSHGIYIAPSSHSEQNILKFVDQSWEPIGTQKFANIEDIVAINDSIIYICGGKFTTLSGRISVWNGQTWTIDTSIVSGCVSNFHRIEGNSIIYSGDFVKKAGNKAFEDFGICGSDSIPFESTSELNGINGTISSSAISNNEIYVAGEFNIAGSLYVNNLAKWNSTWQSIDSPFSNSIDAIHITSNNKLIVAGMGMVQEWDGLTWNDLEIYYTGEINVISSKENELILGGDFFHQSDIHGRHNNIIHIKETLWTNLGYGVENSLGFSSYTSGSAEVHDLEFHESAGFYVVGNFDAANRATAKNIAYWNGSEWISMVSTMEGSFIRSIDSYGDTLFIAGNINSINNTSVNNVAKYYDSTWHSIGGDFSNFTESVSSIKTQGNRIYAGGRFGLDYLDDNWSNLGMFYNGPISRFEDNRAHVSNFSTNDSILVCTGEFNNIDGQLSSGIAIWNLNNNHNFKQESLITCQDTIISINIDNCTGVLPIPNYEPQCNLLMVEPNKDIQLTLGQHSISWVFTNTYGHIDTCFQNVIVIDNNAPEFQAKDSIDIFLGSEECSITSDLIQVPQVFDCSDSINISSNLDTLFLGKNNIRWEARDQYNNSSRFDQIIILKDTISPIITCPEDLELQVDPSSCATHLSNLVNPTVSDNCGITSITNNLDEITTISIGEYDLLWIVEDINGNSSECIQKLTVVDNEAPQIICNPDTTLSLFSLCDSIALVLNVPTAIDNCEIESITNNAPESFFIGNTVITWTARDKSGNETTCEQEVVITMNNVESELQCSNSNNSNRETHLISPCDYKPFAEFAYDVDIQGHIAVIGKQGKESQLGVGAAYIYNYEDQTGWIEQQKLLPETDIVPEDFGKSVAIDGGTIVLGAPLNNDKGTEVGVAYVFEQESNGNYKFSQKLYPSDFTNQEHFGSQVEIFNNTIAIGTIGSRWNDDLVGAVYVFEKINEEWIETQKLIASDGSNQNRFSRSIDISHKTMAIGGTDRFSSENEQVYVFEKNENGVWHETTILQGTSPRSANLYGYSVACSDSIILVGAPLENDDVGSVYCYKKVNSTWSHDTTLVNDNFKFLGVTLSLMDDRFLTSSVTSDGAGLIFRENDEGCWELSDTLMACYPNNSSDIYGFSAALTTNFAIVGDYQDETNATSSGAAYIFRIDSSSVNEHFAIESDNIPDSVYERTSIVISTDNLISNTSELDSILLRRISGPIGLNRNSNGNWDVTFLEIDADVESAIIEIIGFGLQQNQTQSYVISITVQNIPDNTSCDNDTDPPTADCQDLQIILDENGIASITAEQVNNGSTDNCLIDTMFLNRYTYECIDFGTTSNTLTIRDESGNENTCSFTVEILDTIHPTITCPGSVQQTIEGTTIAATEINLGMAIGDDICGISSLSSDAPSVFGLGQTAVTWTAIDSDNNSTTCTQIVEITQSDMGEPDDCRTRDSLILVDLYNATDGDNWTNNSGWLELPLDQWHGIQLNSKGCLTSIQLDNNNLQGPLPINLGTLDEVRLLRMMDNKLTGLIPTTIGNLSQIVNLVLSNNNLNGSIPNSIGNLDKLTALSLSNNSLSGSIPSEIGNLQNLSSFLLNNNSLDGHIPSELGNLSGASIISLSNNALTGPIPKELGNLSSLGSLLLNGNGLTGSIPKELGNLSNLGLLYLFENELSGTIPNELSNLLKLQRFYLSRNKLTGPIPNWLDNMNSLTRIFLNENQLEGSLPEFSNILDKIVILSLFDNNLSGCIPESYHHLCNSNAEIDISENPLLPWQGDFLQFCNTEGSQIDQRGAQCDDNDPATTNDDIQEDCSCKGMNETSIECLNDLVTPQAICKNITVELNNSGNATIIADSIDNSSTDNCAVDTIFLSQYVFDCTEVGQQSATLTVRDLSGNESTCDATVTVEDNIKPIANCRPATLFLDENGKASLTATEINNESSDNCGIQSMIINQTEFSCEDVGGVDILYTVTDIHGNSDTCSTIVTVRDTLNPTLTCTDLTIYLDVLGRAQISPDQAYLNSDDNCGMDTIIVAQTEFACHDLDLSGFEVTAIDLSGNEVTCFTLVEVLDTISPEVTCKNITVELDNSGNVSIIADSINNGSTDNCAIDTIFLSQYDFDCTDVGQQSVTLTVRDLSDNESTCMATVTVEDNVKPIANCQSTTLFLDANGMASLTAADINNESSDNCGIQSLAISQTQFTCADLGEVNVILTVTDVNGNSDSCTTLITVRDTILPIIAATETLSVYLDSMGQASITPEEIDSGSTDNCQIAERELSKTAFTCEDLGKNEITYTIKDAENNSVSKLTIINIVDTIEHTLICNDSTSLVIPSTSTVQISLGDVVDLAYDNCSFNLSIDNDIFTIDDVGINTVMITMENESMIIGQCVSDVHVINSDFDNDGILDEVECPNYNSVISSCDPDNDNIPNFQDLDSDGDSITDDIECPNYDGNVASCDIDNDSIPNYLDTDSDGDGLNDDHPLELNPTFPDCDDDGIVNWKDSDSCIDAIRPPEAFSPNGDGKNESFVILGVESFPNNKLIIFDRTGNLVYEKFNYKNNWGGESQNKTSNEILPIGSYYYVFDYGIEGIEPKTGFVFLGK